MDEDKEARLNAQEQAERIIWITVIDNIDTVVQMLGEMVRRKDEHPDMHKVVMERLEILETLGEGLVDVCSEFRKQMDDGSMGSFQAQMRTWLDGLDKH